MNTITVIECKPGMLVYGGYPQNLFMAIARERERHLGTDKIYGQLYQLILLQLGTNRVITLSYLKPADKLNVPE